MAFCGGVLFRSRDGVVAWYGRFLVASAVMLALIASLVGCAPTLAVSGALADGASTAWALKQSGPQRRVIETNPFYRQLFGPVVSGAEVMAMKAAQGAALGAMVHYIGQRNPQKAMAVAVLVTVAHTVVAVWNVRVGVVARRANR